MISDVVESNSTRVAVTSEWIEVPDNWRNEFAPPETKGFDFIEVMYRDGTRDFDRPDAWTISWNSNAGLAQIIEFRPAKK